MNLPAAGRSRLKSIGDGAHADPMGGRSTDEVVAASLDDIEFIARSGHRVGVLTALATGRLDRSDLREATGASSPTMGRILADFEERRWVTRDGPDYELTQLGAFVADRFGDLCAAMATERNLREVWQWLPREMAGFSVELFADAVVSYPGPGYPYQPLERIAELVESTTRIRGFGTLELKAATIETVCGAVLDGTEMEYVFPPDVLEATIRWDPDRLGEVAACEHCTVYVHDALPDEDRCGLSIVDDRIAICCHEPATGNLAAVVDTGAPEAREWARDVFERLRREATPVEADAVEALSASGETA